MVRSRDNSPTDNKPFVNVLGNLHSDLADALDNFISYIRGRQNAGRDDEDLVRIHTVLLHNNEVPDCEQLEVGPFINQPCFQTCSTCDRSCSHSPVLVEMHNPHAAHASNMAARSPGRPVVQS